MTPMPIRINTKTLCALAIAAASVVAVAGAQSLTYTKGQNIAPAYEGWEQDADGSKYFVFGYMNRNFEEHLYLPIGPDNTFEPAPVDRGQPTYFLPRRNMNQFRVTVPKAFGKNDLIWTITSNGKTERA